MTGNDLITAMNDLCVAYAKAQVAHAMAEHAADQDERAQHRAHAEYWDMTVSGQYRALTEAVGAALPDPVEVESFLPVQPLPTGEVEIRARDGHARPVLVRLSGAQALALGAHLTAYAAIGLDRINGKVAELLPRVGTAEPFTRPPAHATTRAEGAAATRAVRVPAGAQAITAAPQPADR
ncbi:hypothetical protein [Dactylosporangium sp. NPDC051484]|uniref:hypothetical protein n=1 Tax=Dactylosporangium sp. NPDC051484 TaxID=3154942 RepID=UPI00344E408D